MTTPPIATPPYLSLDGISIAYGAKTVVKNISISLEQGDIGCLLGPSGCGKTTVLRAIAGFEPVIGGSITLDEQPIAHTGYTMPPENRQVGMVFQDFALFPHLTVADNIGFGLSGSGMGKDARRERVGFLAHMMGLSGVASMWPHQLSGGQQQRVALARALAPKPMLLLMDEPFSSIDPELREQLVMDVHAALKEENITAILVTHDQQEAFAISDVIGVLEDGHLHQWDSAYALYHEPANRTVADFIGKGTFLRATVVDETTLMSAVGMIKTSLAPALRTREQVEILLRPDDVYIDEKAANPLYLRVVRRLFLGTSFLYTLCLDSGEEILCLSRSHRLYEEGEKVPIHLDLAHVMTF